MGPHADELSPAGRNNPAKSKYTAPLQLLRFAARGVTQFLYRWPGSEVMVIWTRPYAGLAGGRNTMSEHLCQQGYSLPATSRCPVYCHACNKTQANQHGQADRIRLQGLCGSAFCVGCLSGLMNRTTHVQTYVEGM